MHVLNSIIRMVGKTASYIDEEDAHDAHFENPDHAPTKVASTTDTKTGGKVEGDDTSSLATSQGDGNSKDSNGHGMESASRGGSMEGTEAGSSSS